MPGLLNFEKEEKGFERWYANISPKEIRKLIGRKICYVTYVDPHRGYYTVHIGIIEDCHHSLIIFEGGNNVNKRDIKEAGIEITTTQKD